MPKFLISLGGRGSEIYAYNISESEREKLEHINLQECLLDDVASILDMDEMDLVSGDEIYIGAYPEHSVVTVEDEYGDVIVQEDIEKILFQDLDSDQTSTKDVYQSGKVYVNDYVKGRFFEIKINLDEPFDFKKLELHYTNVEGLELISGIKYNGVEGEISDYWSKGITFFLSNE